MGVSQPKCTSHHESQAGTRSGEIRPLIGVHYESLTTHHHSRSLDLRTVRGELRTAFYDHGIRGQYSVFSGHLEKAPHPFHALLVEHVVDVGGEIAPDGLLGNRKPLRPLRYDGLDVFQSMVARANHVFRNSLIQGPAARSAPDRGDKGEPRQRTPLSREVQIRQFLSG